MEKKYVRVEVAYFSDCTVIIHRMFWNDEPYEIDEMIDVRPAPFLNANGRGAATQYTVRIGRHRRTLWFDGKGWFVGTDVRDRY